MRAAQLKTPKFFALLFLLPGLARLIVSAMISTHYVNFMPRQPVLAQDRVVPRGIKGATIYQTPLENRNLNLTEYSLVGVFGLGLILGLVYLEKWGSAQTGTAEEEDMLDTRAIATGEHLCLKSRQRHC